MKQKLFPAALVRLTLSGLVSVLAFTPLRAADESVPQAVASVSSNAPTAGVTNSAPAAAEASAGSTALDYGAFRPMADRNIFNANRSSRAARSGERPKPAQVETLTVVGTMSYAKAERAFFDGSSGAFRKAVKLGELVAGHKVTAITAEEVRLELDGKPITLKVGGQLRREDEGPWEVVAAGVSHSVITAADSSATAASADAEGGSSGEVSDALKRLLQKREQELKNENQ